MPAKPSRPAAKRKLGLGNRLSVLAQSRSGLARVTIAVDPQHSHFVRYLLNPISQVPSRLVALEILALATPSSSLAMQPSHTHFPLFCLSHSSTRR